MYSISSTWLFLHFHRFYSFSNFPADHHTPFPEPSSKPLLMKLLSFSRCCIVESLTVRVTLASMLLVWLCNLFGKLSVVFCVQTPAEKPLRKSRGQTEPGRAPVERLSEDTHAHDHQYCGLCVGLLLHCSLVNKFPVLLKRDCVCPDTILTFSYVSVKVAWRGYPRCDRARSQARPQKSAYPGQQWGL